jgi:hypothetical protein
MGTAPLFQNSRSDGRDAVAVASLRDIIMRLAQSKRQYDRIHVFGFPGFQVEKMRILL